MTAEFRKMLECSCVAAGCTVEEALGSGRKRDYFLARLIFYAIASESGTRSDCIMWMLKKHRSLAHYYEKSLECLYMYKNFKAKLLTAKTNFHAC